MKREIAAVVLAAGLGKRMKSELPKVLHPVMGRPMLDHVLDALERAGVKTVYVVVGHQSKLVSEHVGGRAICVIQSERLGTAHAVLQAREALGDFDGDVLIACGDTPLLRPETLKAAMVERADRTSPGALVATHIEHPYGYGRIVRGKAGRALRVVEEKDATPEERTIREINTGVYCVDCKLLFEALSHVNNKNAQGEYLLTDIVEIFSEQGRAMDTIVAGDSTEVIGVNSRKQLAQAEWLMRMRLLEEYMDEGLTLIDPETTLIEPGVKIGRDVTILPSTSIRGACEIGDGARIGPGVELRSSVVGAGARVIHSWIDASEIGEGARIEPYVRIHPGSRIEPNAIVPSFSDIRPRDRG